MVACDAFCPKCCCHHQRLMFPWQPGEVSRHELNAGKELWSEKLCIWNFWLQLSPFPSQLLYSISRTNCSQDVFLIERALWGEADQLTQVTWGDGGKKRSDQRSLLKVGWVLLAFPDDHLSRALKELAGVTGDPLSSYLWGQWVDEVYQDCKRASQCWIAKRGKQWPWKSENLSDFQYSRKDGNVNQPSSILKPACLKWVVLRISLLLPPPRPDQDRGPPPCSRKIILWNNTMWFRSLFSTNQLSKLGCYFTSTQTPHL